MNIYDPYIQGATVPLFRLDTARNCAYYIKLVSHDYILGFEVSFRDQF